MKIDDTEVFVTTGANLTHDLMEALGERHYHGDDQVNDEELIRNNLLCVKELTVET